MTEVFSGSRAVGHGRLTRHRLRTRFESVHPDVYVPEFTDMTTEDRARAAWLWSKERGVVAGVAASALHGARWVGDDELVETDEIVVVDGITVTSKAAPRSISVVI
jgi:hypothetical protein